MLDFTLDDFRQQFEALQHELEGYHVGLSKRPSTVIINKIDLASKVNFSIAPPYLYFSIRTIKLRIYKKCFPICRVFLFLQSMERV